MATSLRPRDRIVVGVVAVAVAAGGVIAGLLAWQPETPSPVVAAPQQEIEMPVDDLKWSITAPVERVGYQRGQRHILEVVPLGPDAIEVEIATARAFLEMRRAAADDGIDLRLESGFRTHDRQAELFRDYRMGRGNKAAPPGLSNHQSGRALDLVVSSVPGAKAWLRDHAAEFGFIRTVPNEPWHWEHIDSPIARGAVAAKPKAKATKLAKHTKRPTSRARPAKRTASR